LVDLVEDYIEVVHPNCLLGKGIRYVNNERLCKIANSPFKSKAKDGVIFITKMALCHLVEIYGLHLPALPIPIPDFIRVDLESVSLSKIIMPEFFTGYEYS
jgi:hypothetical protein